MQCWSSGFCCTYPLIFRSNVLPQLRCCSCQTLFMLISIYIDLLKISTFVTVDWRKPPNPLINLPFGSVHHSFLLRSNGESRNVNAQCNVVTRLKGKCRPHNWIFFPPHFLFVTIYQCHRVKQHYSVCLSADHSLDHHFSIFLVLKFIVIDFSPVEHNS